MAKIPTFNPVKEETIDQAASRVRWSTESVQLAKDALEKGKKLKANPFFEGTKIKRLKPDLVFNRTPQEIEEWVKCKNDPLYFCNTYAQLMTPKGIQHIELRDYQKDYIEHCKKNRLTIFLSCRQAGKCTSLSSTINVQITDDFLWDLDGKEKWKAYLIKENIYNIPIFELINLYENSFVWKIKYFLYKMLYKLN